MRIPQLLVILTLSAGFARAQDGGQLYTTYCSACHGANGEGATGGQFPPLAGSPWVLGDGDRAIKVVLHGLQGPVEVNGRNYDLVMPPQGASLTDEQISAILSYVRTTWGNQATPLKPEDVKAAREATADRSALWTADEILKIHPLPLEKTALRNLISRTYRSTWSSLPDLDAQKPLNVEEEHDGIISVEDSTLDDNFAMMWEGEFEAPADGEYRFILDADDSAVIMVGGKKVVSVEGSGAMNGSRAESGKVTLKKGLHPFRAEFLENSGEQGIAIAWKASDDDRMNWLTKQTTGGNIMREPIPIVPENGRPVIYRNFIDGTTPRAIGVGFPGGTNLAYSADHLAPELIWTGDFINGSAKWRDRGTATSPPAGERITKLSDQRFLPDEARFKGYRLDSEGNPSFIVRLGDQILTDTWKSGPSSSDGPTLIRTLLLRGEGGKLRIPLGRFEDIESDSPTDTRDGETSVTLSPGVPTQHVYSFAP